jgi:uncharacterized protein YndB with AHSA1/START domain
MPKKIKIERIYTQSIEQVWNAISSQDALAEWLMPNDFKLVKGHTFKFKAPKQPGFDGIVNCEVIDFKIPTKLQFTWQGGPLKNPTLITFQLEAIKEGTKLTFTQSGFEGFIGGYVVRFILGQGWKNLLNKKIITYLTK